MHSVSRCLINHYALGEGSQAGLTHTCEVQSALAAASHSAAATRQLLDCLPPMDALLVRGTSMDQAAWLTDTVLASRVQFLMNVLTACVAATPEVRWMPCVQLAPTAVAWRAAFIIVAFPWCQHVYVQEAAEKAAPVAMLYLQHPSAAVATAASSLACALVQAADPLQRGSLATVYLERALSGYPATLPTASLAVGVDTLAHALPAGCSNAPLMATSLAERVGQLAQQSGMDAVRAQPGYDAADMNNGRCIQNAEPGNSGPCPSVCIEANKPVVPCRQRWS